MKKLNKIFAVLLAAFVFAAATPVLAASPLTPQEKQLKSTLTKIQRKQQNTKYKLKTNISQTKTKVKRVKALRTKHNAKVQKTINGK